MSPEPVTENHTEVERFAAALVFAGRRVVPVKDDTDSGPRRWRFACPLSGHADDDLALSAQLVESVNGAPLAVCSKHAGIFAEVVAAIGYTRQPPEVEPVEVAQPAPQTAVGEPVDGAALLDDIVVFLQRFVRFAFPEQVDALALHVVAGHALDAFDCAPYVALTSAEKRSGKTRTLETIELLLPRPWRISAAPSVASLFRKIESDEPVALIDEVDLLFAARDDSTRAIVAAINAGYRRGATVPRVVGEGADLTTRDFSVYCVKVLAGIDASRWPDTVRDRCIVIALRRRTTGERVERFRRRDIEPEADELRGRIEAWSAANVERLRKLRIDDISSIDDRAFEIWEPLLAVAEIAGERWAERARGSAITLSSSRDVEGESFGVRLLRDLKVVFAQHAIDSKLSSAVAIDALNRIDDAPWGAFRDGAGIDAFRLARLLRPFEVRTRDVRIGAERVKGWTVDDLADAWARYLPSTIPPPAKPATSATPATSDGSAT